MANNNYSLLLEAKIDPSKIQSTIKAIQAKNTLTLNVQLNQGDLTKLNGVLDKLKQSGNKISKLTLSEDNLGGIKKAVIEYTDKLGNAVKITEKINTQVKATKQHTIDLAKNEQDLLRLRTAGNRELEKAAMNASKFLERSKNMAQTKSVVDTRAKAEEIKVAVSEGDIAKVRKLNDQFALLKSSLQSGRSELKSWSDGIGNAIKQTVQYSLSIGLVYGALQQLKSGIEYVKDLNKELTNIQLIQADGAQTDEEISSLSMRYNDLAKSLGVTTLEVAKGILYMPF